MLGYTKTLVFIVVTIFLTSGCTKSVRFENTVLNNSLSSSEYSIENLSKRFASAENVFIVNFSGGGTRAAALSYGVLAELDEHPSMTRLEDSLLDDVNLISSVSGGSFTAAYYGLHGKKIFDSFEAVFLHEDFQGSLVKKLLSIGRLFSDVNRTEAAIKLYDEKIFHGARFSDMIRDDGPIIVINASDLGGGIRFSFLQKYFDLLCSDLSSYSVSRAVAASSAVPLMFSPVVLKNHNCYEHKDGWILGPGTRKKDQHWREVEYTVESLAKLADKQKRAYLHLVDGGITDNLGLRAVYDLLSTGDGVLNIRANRNRNIKRFIVLSVDASVDANKGLDESPMEPSIADTLAAVSKIQLHRYNVATLELLEDRINRWAEELSDGGSVVEPFFIRIALSDISEEPKKSMLNNVPTSLSLSESDVSLLINSGRELLNSNKEFVRLLEHINTP